MATHRKEYKEKITSGNTVNIDTLDKNDEEFQYTISHLFVGTDGNYATFKVNKGPEMRMPSGKHYVLNIWEIEVTDGEVVVYGTKNKKVIP